MILFAVLTCPAVGQVKTAVLTESDYQQWGTLTPHAVSDQGNWTCYSMEYDSGQDTLFIQNIKTMESMKFPKGRLPAFIGEKQFVHLKGNQIRLTALGTRSTDTISNVQNYIIVGNALIVHKNDGTLLIIKEGFKITNLSRNVTAYAVSPDKNRLVYSISAPNSSTLKVVNLINESIVQVAENKTDEYYNFVWEGKSRSFAYLRRNKNNYDSALLSVGFYNIVDDRLYEASCSNALWPAGFQIPSPQGTSMIISDDNTSVFFQIALHVHKGENLQPQIWNARDKAPYAYRKAQGHPATWPQLCQWQPTKGTLSVVGSGSRTRSLLLNGQQYALIFDPLANRPSLKYEPDRDYYLKNLKTGTEEILLAKFSGRLGNVISSPEGNFIAYFKDCNWWIYSVASGTHKNLTQKIVSEFCDCDFDRPDAKPPFGFAGWSEDEASVLIYDKFKIWQIGVLNGRAKSLLPDSSNDFIWRIYNFNKPVGDNFYQRFPTYNLQRPILLQAMAPDYSKAGYFFLNQGRLKQIVIGNKKISKLMKASSRDCYTVVEENFNEPPGLVFLENGKEKLIVRSNLQHYNFSWGKSKLISYENSAGKKLQGVLFYPFGFEPARTYPMVVHIYERQNHHLTQYNNPGLSSAVGFNKTNFAGQGYFVFYPDIVYSEGNPGLSALDCVVSGVEAVLATVPVNKHKIGLIGHSFGAYETNFIISQTSLFAAAVSGNGISDLKSLYLSTGWSYGLPNTWRFESDQFRIPFSLFDMPDLYERNSPVNYLKDVTTPLLSWVGQQDTQVDPFQTMEMHIGLTRLGKNHIMLVYPDEGHVLLQKENQADLSKKIMDWFNSYLKAGPPPGWTETQ